MAGRVGLRIAEMGMGWEMDRGDDRDDRNGRDGRGKNWGRIWWGGGWESDSFD